MMMIDENCSPIKPEASGRSVPFSSLIKTDQKCWPQETDTIFEEDINRPIKHCSTVLRFCSAIGSEGMTTETLELTIRDRCN